MSEIDKDKSRIATLVQNVTSLPVSLASTTSAAARGVSRKKRAAIYCRFSSKSSEETSIERQEETGRRYAEQKDFEVVRVYADRAFSGRTIKRPDMHQLMRDAEQGQFDVVISEDVDRLGRACTVIATLSAHLYLFGIEIHSVTLGMMGELHLMIVTAIADHQRRLLAERTQTGRRMKAERGLDMGGGSYGYNASSGVLTINEEEASVVVRIFEMRGAGMSREAIATMLNHERIAAPGRVGSWRPYHIAKRTKNERSGILYDTRYIALLIYGRRECRLDPDTHKTSIKPLPPSRWIVRECPDIRIVTDDLWRAAHAIEEAMSTGELPNISNDPYLILGITQCPVCNRRMNNYNVRRGQPELTRLRCSAFQYDRSCELGDTHVHAHVQRAAVALLRSLLDTPEAAKRYAEVYAVAREEAFTQSQTDRVRLDEQIESLDRKLERLFKQHLELGFSNDRRERWIARLEEELQQARMARQALPAPVPELRFDEELVTSFHQALDQLEDIAPFQATSPEGERLIAAFHRVVRCIKPYGITTQRGFRLIVEVRVGAFVSPLGVLDEAETLFLEGTFVPHHGRRRERSDRWEACEIKPPVFGTRGSRDVKHAIVRDPINQDFRALPVMDEVA